MFTLMRSLCISALITFMAIASAPSSVEAAAMHAILVGDTNSEELSEGILEDLTNMSVFLHTAAASIDLDYNEMILVCDDVNSWEVFSQINDMTVDRDDVVFFYFSGHGYRNASKASSEWWPNLFLKKDKAGIDLGDVVAQIRLKEPRLIFAIGDCCNNIIPDRYAPALIYANKYRYAYKSSSFFTYQKLFLDIRGEIIVAGAKPGSYGIGTHSGGIFTLCFIEMVKAALQQQGNSWDKILSDTVRLVYNETMHSGIETQMPFYEVNIINTDVTFTTNP